MAAHTHTCFFNSLYDSWPGSALGLKIPCNGSYSYDSYDLLRALESSG
uniref:Uncharacterized protein n=1 Tax=Anguilla anguilla TaxID=7936 RepID=A0A0E9Q5P0_ANGAN